MLKEVYWFFRCIFGENGDNELLVETESLKNNILYPSRELVGKVVLCTSTDEVEGSFYSWNFYLDLLKKRMF